MKFKCPHCGQVFKRDLRKREYRRNYSKVKKAYLSACKDSDHYWCKEAR